MRTGRREERKRHVVGGVALMLGVVLLTNIGCGNAGSTGTFSKVGGTINAPEARFDKKEAPPRPGAPGMDGGGAVAPGGMAPPPSRSGGSKDGPSGFGAAPPPPMKSDDRAPADDSAGERPVYAKGRSPLTRSGKEGEGVRKKPDQPPQVWKRDDSQPSFARIYVGDGNALELVSLHVTVTVEGPRARTLVDHIFRNPHDRQLEGTFEYPLPTGASPSYFAMFLGQTRDTVPPRWGGRNNTPPPPPDALARLSPAEVVKQVSTADWGRLQEARVVSKEKALETYEEVVRGRIDPALLEYGGANTFRGRVFPIPPKGYNRVLIAYEEVLPFAGDRCVYRFPLPEVKLTDLQFHLNASTAECKDASFAPKDAKKAEGGSLLAYSKTWADKGPGGEALFAFRPPLPQVQAVTGRQGESGPLYLYARLRPELKVEKAEPFAKHAVFLLDTSLSEHPDRFGVSMKLLRKVLETDPDVKHFNVLAFSVGAAWAEPKGWLENTPANRDKVFAALDGLVLEGATDLSTALDALASPADAQPPLAGLEPGAPLNVFLLSDGQITWGESDAAALAARFEARCPFRTRFHCYRTGLGADNVELFEALTRRGGGVFNCFGEGDVAPAAAAHRSQCLTVERVRITGGPAAEDVLVAGRRAAVYPGGDLLVAARVAGPGKTTIVVEGSFLGQKYVQEYAVDVAAGGELAARGWGEVAVASLLALNDPTLDGVVTAYCQEFGIGSRVASFLVLENDADYKRFNLQQERGQAIARDLGAFLDDAWRGLSRGVGAREAYLSFLERVRPQLKVDAKGDGARLKKLLDLLTDKDFELPAGQPSGALVTTDLVPPAYLQGRDADRGNVATYLTESRRRLAAKDVGGAVRALSSVVEVHPGRSDALRLVGYRLLDLGEPAQAVRLFEQVQRQRPFEPHSYRDLARGLESSTRYGLAAAQYEIVLAGTWHNRFRDSLKTVAREEYAQLLSQAVRDKAVDDKLRGFFGDRLRDLGGTLPDADLRVTMSWNSDATDVDLWVIEPDGTKCFYQHQKTRNGGELSQDQTQGYGPERYQVRKALKGEYRVLVHYFAPNMNLIGGETHVNVVVTQHAGTPHETTERRTIILKRKDEQVEVCRVKF